MDSEGLNPEWGAALACAGHRREAGELVKPGWGEGAGMR